MAKVASFISLGFLTLESSSSVPLYRQLYQGLREAILTGHLAPGTRLPSTRALAVELGTSRNTVLNAFEQLMAEGYLEAHVGVGTFVTEALPEAMLRARRAPGEHSAAESLVDVDAVLSQRGTGIVSTSGVVVEDVEVPFAFTPGLPALDAFPVNVWKQLVARRWRTLPLKHLSYGASAGYRPLREAIAAYLGMARGVRCEADQVIIVAGVQQGIDLAVRLLLDPGDEVWIEDPVYPGARGALLGAGARLAPLPVDDEGLCVEAGLARYPHAKMAYVTPSHQFPLGVTMSLARRLALLQWAASTGAWIVEDDYDSEYRYAGRPLAALQGLDTAGRVIYIGTFSKVLFPALRLGYLVVPPPLVDAFVAARALVDRCPPLLDQAVLTDFITEGHFARQIRRMRTLYAERQAALVETVTETLNGLIELHPAESGMHLIGWLPDGMADDEVSRRLARQQVAAPPLSAYTVTEPQRSGLVLGYAAANVEQIRSGAARMAAVLNPL